MYDNLVCSSVSDIDSSALLEKCLQTYNVSRCENNFTIIMHDDPCTKVNPNSSLPVVGVKADVIK